MRILVSLSVSNPELLAEIEKLPRRKRAGRLRMLAEFGLMNMKAHVHQVPSSMRLGQSPVRPVTPTANPEKPARVIERVVAEPTQSVRKVPDTLGSAKKRAMARIGASFHSDTADDDSGNP